MTLKRPKKAGGKKKKPVPVPAINRQRDNDSDGNEDDGEYGDKVNLILTMRRFHLRFYFTQQSDSITKPTSRPQIHKDMAGDEIDPDDPNLTIPLTRYHAMLAILRNTLYM